MADNQINQTSDISDPSIEKLNDDVANILGKTAPGQEPVFRKSDSNIPPLRTYKADYSDLIKNQKIGKVEMVAAEIKRGVDSNAYDDPEIKRNEKINLLLPILIFLAIGVAGYLAFLFLKLGVTAPMPKQLAQIPPPLIFSEKQEKIILKDATKNELGGEIGRALQKPFPQNNIVYLPIIKDAEEKETYIDLENFITIAGLNLPADIAQSLENSYTMGLYSKNEKYPLLILKIKLYENAFSGMIAWENKMASDLANIWPIKKTTSSDTFKDQTINNHDIRELKDSDGNLVLTYSFLDRKTLVISTNEGALATIFERFTFR